MPLLSVKRAEDGGWNTEEEGYESQQHARSRPVAGSYGCRERDGDDKQIHTVCPLLA